MVWLLRPGLLVRDEYLGGCVGRLTRVGRGGVITVSTSVTYPPRRRFVIAHELGHFEVHGPEQNQLSLCAHADTSEQGLSCSQRMPTTEREANAFATEFLMPKALWGKRSEVKKPTLDIVQELRSEFEVSLTAATLRFVKLTPERCAVAFSTDGAVEWVATSEDFGHFIKTGLRLSKFTNAHDYFAGKECSRTSDPVPASAWLDGFRVPKDEDIYEHTCVIESLKATLSLLWIPSDAEY
jgi:hypothetical protein